jgi:hypothetical protein
MERGRQRPKDNKEFLLAKTAMTPASKLTFCENGILLKAIFSLSVIPPKN